MDPLGYQCLILHAHLPFVRHPEHEDPLEERWLHEAMTECYLPLLDVLDGWRRDRVDWALGLSISPTLLTMLRDPLLIDRYRAHLDRLIELARREVTRTRLSPELNPAACHYLACFESCRRNLDETWGGDVPGAFAEHASEGRLELLGGPATHPFLPLMLHEPEAIRVQLRVGLDEIERQLGLRPRGMWIPECGYAPGLDDFLVEAGVNHTIVDAHGLIQAWPPQSSIHQPVRTPAGLGVLGRDPETSRQVWNAQEGYPGDPMYREFYRDIGHDLDREWLGRMLPAGVRVDTGIKYHRITGAVALGDKQIYDPDAAREQIQAHAEHFVASRVNQSARLVSLEERIPVIVSPYDAELFGHWWYEGPRFLDSVMRRLGAPGSPVKPITPAGAFERCPVAEMVQPSFSSWGEGGYAEIWLNEQTEWIYPRLDAAVRRMRSLARRHRRNPDPSARRALAQMERELLLAQASDWPFLIRLGNAPHYARERICDHLGTVRRLAGMIDRGEIDEADLARAETCNNIFPAIDFTLFA